MPDEGMNPADRLALVDHADPVLSIVAQCRLLKVARSTLYYRPAPVSMDDLTVMRRMDELHLAYPFYGSRRMAAELRREGWSVNRKRAKRLMRMMGLEAIYQKPNTSRGHPGHQVYPYLLRGLVIDRPNQVWCADITYIPMAKGFVYLVAVGAADAFRHIDPLRGPMDWFSRRVLSWRVSITMDTTFCVEALQEAMDRHGKPEIFNTDQGVQFTSADFLNELASRGVRISMDGKGRYLDNIFIERLWRSLKYEEVYIKAYGSVAGARRGIGGWLTFYNDERPHQALSYRTPREVFEDTACEHVDNASASLRCARALPTCSQALQQQQDNKRY
jgi:putative transposase